MNTCLCVSLKQSANCDVLFITIFSTLRIHSPLYFLHVYSVYEIPNLHTVYSLMLSFSPHQAWTYPPPTTSTSSTQPTLPGALFLLRHRLYLPLRDHSTWCRLHRDLNSLNLSLRRGRRCQNCTVTRAGSTRRKRDTWSEKKNYCQCRERQKKSKKDLKKFKKVSPIVHVTDRVSQLSRF